MEELNKELQKQTQPYRRISNLEDRTFEITQTEEQKEKEMEKSETIHVVGIPEEKEKGRESVFLKNDVW